jgi:hypothetical protein
MRQMLHMPAFRQLGSRIEGWAVRPHGRTLARRRQKGQAAIELLLIIPTFVALILVTIDFGVWMYGFVSAANAAREGARWGAVNCASVCDTADIVGRVKERAGNFPIVDTDIEVGLVDGADSNTDNYNAGDSVVVSITHIHSLLFWPGSVSISTCAQMRLESATPGTSLLGGTAC